ncbi:uncharacterized protein LOC143911968 [Arctopsyche grandis]|uniref:uncharacterized protein LOC143911968 n=1 Tax=Arctopsyche grandis TaxID=121162 RepID=UPI00406D6BC0
MFFFVIVSGIVKMLVYWETSQRPLTIKTVWIKGHRHAILSEKDVLKKNHNKKEKHRRMSDESPQSSSLADYDSAVNFQKIIPIRNSPNSISVNRNLKSNYSHIQKSGHLEPNPLSERVLQWLDLAGQATVKYIGESRLSKIRHSVPEVKVSHNEFKLMKTDIEFKDNDYNYDIQKTNSGRKINDTKVFKYVTDDPLCKFESEVQVLYKNSGKKQNEEVPKNFSEDDDLNSEIIDDTECNSDDDESELQSKCKIKETFAFEHDYINIIKKQIFESSCNTYVARKKLHIFIPSLPKKAESSIDNESNISGLSIKKIV